ncbi:MAG: hypothetical protein ACLFSN_01130 [Candidatus Woesearchaeota archaeon]
MNISPSVNRILESEEEYVWNLEQVLNGVKIFNDDNHVRTQIDLGNTHECILEYNESVLSKLDDERDLKNYLEMQNSYHYHYADSLKTKLAEKEKIYNDRLEAYVKIQNVVTKKEGSISSRRIKTSNFISSIFYPHCRKDEKKNRKNNLKELDGYRQLNSIVSYGQEFFTEKLSDISFKSFETRIIIDMLYSNMNDIRTLHDSLIYILQCDNEVFARYNNLLYNDHKKR